MARGRKPKPGKRYPNGKRKPQPQAATFDRGSEWVQRQRERFGEHYSSALGRAYAAGLLGEDAQRLYDAGKHFARIYNAVIGPVVYRCALNDEPRGLSLVAADPDMDERHARQKDWLFSVMDALDVDGTRPWLDQLIHVNYTDSGPPWLDHLLHGSKDPVDRMFLDAAIRALDIIAPAKREPQIRAA